MTTLDLTHSLEIAVGALEEIAADCCTDPRNRERAHSALLALVTPHDARSTSAARVSALSAPRL